VPADDNTVVISLAMPTNYDGPTTTMTLEVSHVLPALIRRFHEAKVAKQLTVTLWGTGTR
jgi:GDP-L-fucose synthase